MASAKPANKWTAKELKARIARRHPLDKGWFTTTEHCPVSGSGGSAGRMDALAVCLYGRSGFEAHGFEVKVSRSDWLSELNNPAKNAAALDEVDCFWLVVPSTDIAKIEELPPKWGMMTCSGRGLRIIKRAERMTEESAPFSRPFVVSLLWKIANFQTPSDKALAEARLDGIHEGEKRGRSHARQFVGMDVREFDRIKQVMADFKAKAGFDIQYYDGGEIGALAQLMRTEGGRHLFKRELERAQAQAADFEGQMAEALQELEKIPPIGERVSELAEEASNAS